MTFDYDNNRSNFQAVFLFFFVCWAITQLSVARWLIAYKSVQSHQIMCAPIYYSLQELVMWWLLMFGVTYLFSDFCLILLILCCCPRCPRFRRSLTYINPHNFFLGLIKVSKLLTNGCRWVLPVMFVFCLLCCH